MSEIWIYILIMAGVTYFVRVLPLTLIRKPIENKFIKSFLYYVPYVTISVMTFPAIIQATQVPIAGVVALILGVVAAWKGAKMVTVAGICCLSVFVVEYITLNFI